MMLGRLEGMKAIKLGTICLILAAALVGCGGGGTGTTGGNPTPQGKLVDPSGNWKQSFTDASGNTFILSALYNQVGSVVSGINFSEVGNQAPGFQCAAQRDINLSNGLVSNVSTFTGTLSGNFGTISFTSTLNDAGTHAAGTYTVTPGANGNCLGIALTGTFTGDEVPSMSGNWTGTVTCVLNCPTGFTSGTISMSLSQNDATGVVTGSYTITGVPGISRGNLVPDPLGNNFISGASIQQKLGDNNGSTIFLVGGPVQGPTFNNAGLGLDRTFHGNLATGGSSDPLYAVSMSH
jgi:hypothetical protein